MSILKSRNIPVEIADILSNKIIRQELKSGERILEASLAADLKVSQTSIREALRILEQNGLVEIIPRKGTYVTELTIENIEMLFDMLTELYVIMAKTGVKKASDANPKKVFKLLDEIEESAKSNDVEKYYTGIFEFALENLNIINNRLLKKSILDLWTTKRRVEYLTLNARKSELDKNSKYFKLLKKHLIKLDSEKLSETIREYIQNEKKTAIDIIKRNKIL